MSSESSNPSPYEFITQATLPTKHGEFDIFAFEHRTTKQEHVMLGLNLSTKEQPIDEAVLMRIHSECLTGDAFGSLRCDCGPQLNATMQMIQKAGRGAILYLRQEGRGIGLTNKIRAYALQDQGHDTLDANLMLGLPADARVYDMCKTMLNHVGITKVRLMTNNSRKIADLQAQGIDVVERVPLYVGLNPFNEGYLDTKRKRMGHLD